MWPYIILDGNSRGNEVITGGTTKKQIKPHKM